MDHRLPTTGCRTSQSKQHDRPRTRACPSWRLLWAVLLLTFAPPADAASGNILLLLADDMGVDVSQFYRNPVRLETTPPAPAAPHLEALARRGIMFNRVWATPWCSPTRSAILTGRYGFRTGIGRPKTAGLPELSPSELILPEAFRAEAPNYILAHVGKWHLSSGLSDPNLHGWPHYAGPTPALGRINSFFRWPKVVNGVASISTTYATSDQVNEALKVIAQAKRLDRPYLLWVAFTAPHAPYHKPPNSLITRDYLPPSGAPKRDYYAAMIEALDAEVGRLLKSVDLATTTVMFLGDNGTPTGIVEPPYSGAHAKGTVYDGGMHVPLLVAGAGVAHPGREVSALVNATDLFPTILQLGGIDPSRAIPRATKTDGVTLLPYLADQAHPAPRQWAFGELFTDRYDADWQRAIRDERYTLIERYDGSREFYNLQADPLQQANLLERALAPAEAKRLAWLAGRLDALLATR